nr:hypothetical protein [Tanacetum cinerariifolium]
MGSFSSQIRAAPSSEKGKSISLIDELGTFGTLIVEWMGGEGITHWLKGLGVTCEHLGANGGKKRYLATVVQIWEGDKRFGGFGRVSPWGWEGLTLKVQVGVKVLQLGKNTP